MSNSDKGIHHITVLSGEPQRTHDFYTRGLGLRLIMKTVNQDDPSAYHLFYSNGTGQPGSSLTFFPWPGAARGRPGSGEAGAVALAAPTGSEQFWEERLRSLGVVPTEGRRRFGLEVLGFQDPDGLQLELVFDGSVNEIAAWDGGSVSAEYGIRGFYGTTLRVLEVEGTAELLESVFGIQRVADSGGQLLLRSASPVGGAVLLELSREPTGRPGRGTVHHVAFRARDEAEQAWMRAEVQKRGLRPTDVIDRHFFRSVYFQSPGGVLFEIATDGPGYASVQLEKELGARLYLPEWLEKRRAAIEANLPPIQ